MSYVGTIKALIGLLSALQSRGVSLIFYETYARDYPVAILNQNTNECIFRFLRIDILHVKNHKD